MNTDLVTQPKSITIYGHAEGSDYNNKSYHILLEHLHSFSPLSCPLNKHQLSCGRLASFLGLSHLQSLIAWSMQIWMGKVSFLRGGGLKTDDTHTGGGAR